MVSNRCPVASLADPIYRLELGYDGILPHLARFVFFTTQKAAVLASQALIHGEDNREFTVMAAPGPEEVGNGPSHCRSGRKNAWILLYGFLFTISVYSHCPSYQHVAGLPLR